MRLLRLDPEAAYRPEQIQEEAEWRFFEIKQDFYTREPVPLLVRKRLEVLERLRRSLRVLHPADPLLLALPEGHHVDFGLDKADIESLVDSYYNDLARLRTRLSACKRLSEAHELILQMGKCMLAFARHLLEHGEKLGLTSLKPSAQVAYHWPDDFIQIKFPLDIKDTTQTQILRFALEHYERWLSYAQENNH